MELQRWITEKKVCTATYVYNPVSGTGFRRVEICLRLYKSTIFSFARWLYQVRVTSFLGLERGDKRQKLKETAKFLNGS